MSEAHRLEVPTISTRLACGTWSWGDKTWDYDKSKDYALIQDVWSTLNESHLGFYDTAEVYGNGKSEEIIGRLLAESAVDRNDIVIATKWLPLPIYPGRLVPRGIAGALKQSLGRMGIEQCDLYQVHAGWEVFYSIETIAKALADCVKRGLTKTVGVSNYSMDQMLRMHHALAKYNVPLASIQIEFNFHPFNSLPETGGLIAAAQERGITVLAYSPLGQGRLTGKYSAQHPPPSKRKFSPYPMEDLESLLAAMRQLATDHAVPISAIALNWVICKGAVPLGGARNKEQATQNLCALGWRLSADEILRLDALSRLGSVSSWQKG